MSCGERYGEGLERAKNSIIYGVGLLNFHHICGYPLTSNQSLNLTTNVWRQGQDFTSGNRDLRVEGTVYGVASGDSTFDGRLVSKLGFLDVRLLSAFFECPTSPRNREKTFIRTFPTDARATGISLDGFRRCLR